MPRIRIPNNWEPRKYQLPLWMYLQSGGREAVAVWHRRAGKDEVGLHWACVAAHQRKANYWHMLPEAKQARKVVWEAINPHSGIRRIDEAFPIPLRSFSREDEMIIGLKCGSTWQVVGSDNYNSLVGAPPAGIVYSEWSVAKPQARAYLRPILAENKGWELFLYTPRGRNHGLNTLQAARNTTGSFAQVLTADDTGAIAQETLAGELAAYRKEYGHDEGESFFRQEYYCDFNAAILGAIVGRYIERADQERRINDDVQIDEYAPIYLSSDIGFHDTAAWWFWQPCVGGYKLIDYDADNGLDAEGWIKRLKSKPYQLSGIWLPQDAKAKTFQSRHSAVEQFLEAFGPGVVRIVPPVKVHDRINAARSLLPRCTFHATRCEAGLEALRSWSYTWNMDTRSFSKEPLHDWASHPGDSFSYGATVMQEMLPKIEPPITMPRGLTVGANTVTLDELWAVTRRPNERI
jgi:phage terminase large subunit